MSCTREIKKQDINLKTREATCSEASLRLVGSIVRITRFQAELARSGFTRTRYSRLLYILLFTMALPVLHVDVNYLEEKGKYSDALDSIWYKSCCR